MPAATPSALANSVMSKLYDVLTSGDATVPPSADNFFTWCTPGIPMDPADFEFLSQGLRGVVKPPAPAGSNTPPPPPLTPAELNALRATSMDQKFIQAEALARLVDFVPDVSQVANQQFARLNVMNNDGTLSDVYERALRASQVMHKELPAATKEKIEKFRKLLTKVTKKKSLSTDEEVETVSESDLVVAYHEKMAAYDAAALVYNTKRIDALVAENPRAIADFALNADIYRNKVRQAMRDWQTNGYKEDYEEIAAYIAQAQENDMKLLKEEYKDTLVKARLTGISSGSVFYYTALVPGSFATSTGWTEFSFDSGDFNSRSNTSYEQRSTTGGGGASFFGIFGGRASHTSTSGRREYHGSFDSSTFSMSFDICQVPIVRPWFKTAFLTSKAWRFDPADPDMGTAGLSDGGNPPKGQMPAYPTSCVFIRNLVLKMGQSSGFSNFVSEHSSSSTSGGGFVCIGPVFLGGSASHASASGSTERNWGYKFTNEGMVVPGMQLIGFKCHVLPKCPNPSPAITEFVGG